ncbi:MAG: AAA family ATPase, partial [Hyphomicrobiaceae bacterium]
MAVTDIERGLIARYAYRVLTSGSLPVRVVRQVMWWLYERSEQLGLPIPRPVADIFAVSYTEGLKLDKFEAAYAETSGDFLVALDYIAKQSPRPDPLAANIESMVLALNIAHPDAAWKTVGLVACTSRYDMVQYFANHVQEVAGPMARAAALLVGEPLRVVEECLSPAGDLVGSGLLQFRDGDYFGGSNARFVVPMRIDACLDRTYRDFGEMRNALLGRPSKAGVRLDDYEHVSEDRDLICAVLKGGARDQAVGVNVLLYGPPGSGKTELAKVAAETAGLTLYAAGEESTLGAESDRSARLSDLVFSARLLAGEKGTAILFDEMEDIAVNLIRRGGSKVFINRLLETAAVQIVWTSNELGSIDPAMLRRMTLAIELKRPPAAQRRRIMAQLLKRNNIAIPEEQIDSLAQSLDATPAIIENAIRAARFAGGGAETIERAARGIMRAVTGQGA